MGDPLRPDPRDFAGAAGRQSVGWPQRSAARWIQFMFNDFEPNMLLWLRCHVPLDAAFESVCVAGMRRGGGATWGESIAIARGMREGLRIIQLMGYTLYPSGKARLNASPGPGW